MVRNLPFSFWGVTWYAPDFPVPATGPFEARLETSEPCFPFSYIPKATIVPVPSKTSQVFLFLMMEFLVMEAASTRRAALLASSPVCVPLWLALVISVTAVHCPLGTRGWEEVGAEHVELLDHPPTAAQWLCPMISFESEVP